MQGGRKCLFISLQNDVQTTRNGNVLKAREMFLFCCGLQSAKKDNFMKDVASIANNVIKFSVQTEQDFRNVVLGELKKLAYLNDLSVNLFNKTSI